MDVFFYTEKAHAVMPAKVRDEGGRAAPQEMTSSLYRGIYGGDGRPPGSSGKIRLKGTSQFGIKKTSISQAL